MIYDSKSNWKQMTVGDLYSIGSGLSKNRSFFGTGFPFLSFRTIFNNFFLPEKLEDLVESNENEREKCSIKKGDIFLTRTSETSDELGMSSVALTDYPQATFNGFTKRLRKKNDSIQIDPLYIGYYMRSPFFRSHIVAMTTLTTRASLNNEMIERLPIVLPDIEVQIKLGRTLKSIDDKILLNKKINDNLAQQASAIYQAWFEDFIPFDGVCPSSWNQGTLADIADITSGKRPPVKFAVQTDTAVIPLVGAASVMGYTTEANHTDKILVTGRVGTHGVVQRFNSPCWTSDNTLVISSRLYEYTFQILQRIDYRSMNRGSTQPLITQGDMNRVPIMIPDQGTLEHFEALVGQLMEQYEANIITNNKLAELRDTLLPELMSGKIDISSITL